MTKKMFTEIPPKCPNLDPWSLMCDNSLRTDKIRRCIPSLCPSPIYILESVDEERSCEKKT